MSIWARIGSTLFTLFLILNAIIALILVNTVLIVASIFLLKSLDMPIVSWLGC